MTSRFTLCVLFITCLTGRVFADDAADRKAAADKAAADQAALEERVRARLAEHAAKKQAPIAPVTPEKPATPAPAPAAAKDAAPPAPEKPKEEPVMSLPQMEVRKSKIIEITRELQEKDKEIAREKKNLKSSELDKTLNDPKVSNALTIFGGKSTEVKESLAAQRLTLLEAERDVLEAMASAKTDKERDELNSELEEYKTMRRSLDQPPK